MSAACLLLVAFLAAASEGEAPIDPIPPVLVPAGVPRWDFADGTEGWHAQNQCRLSAAAGVLRVECSGSDPYFHRDLDVPGGQIAVRLRARSKTEGAGQVFWTSTDVRQRQPDKAPSFAMIHDGQWHEYQVTLDVQGRLTNLRIDPGTAPGAVEIDWIELLRPHPLSMTRVDLGPAGVRFEVANRGPAPVEAQAADETQTVAPGGSAAFTAVPPRKKPLEAVTLEVQADGLPPLRRTVFVHHADAETEWLALPLDGFTLQVAKDGSLARIRKGEKLVALIGPIVHVANEVPAMRVAAADPRQVRFEGGGVSLTVAADGREISFRIDSQKECEGPVVRVFGGLEQGIFAGLEYLGRGERSSSKLDIETPEHVRSAPDLDKVTMPLMAVTTDLAAVGLTWRDMGNQPVFAAPNFIDAAPDHRMALRGLKIEATVRFDDVKIEELILWAVKQHGLPPLPPAPRTPAEQRELCLKALSGPLKTEKGWGHCLGWPSQPFADHASTVWRLTGEVPEFDRFVPGGAHVANEAVWFVTGRAGEWLQHRRNQARGLIKQQGPDGGFRYDGPFGRGHWENTASGVCARPAYVLLETARLTGDKEALAAGLKALEFLKRFGEPRGAQTWEVPLHTPDILASAYGVWACVLGYELTGDRAHLAEARRWALSGVPFTYLWGRYPVMCYATIPVFGATHWTGSWFGLPVQWCGGVYAYALTRLAPYDDTLDWNHLARGILVSAQQQQYPEGRQAGLLPDSFALKAQRRQPADINPCALVSLEMALDGKLDGLAVATADGRRVVAPFPVTIREGKAHVRGRKGVSYQVVIDGKRVVDVASQGDDVVPLE